MSCSVVFIIHQNEAAGRSAVSAIAVESISVRKSSRFNEQMSSDRSYRFTVPYERVAIFGSWYELSV